MARMVLAFDWTQIIVAVLTGSAITALLGLVGQRFVKSGRVRTTDADQLWKQEERVRAALERDNDRLRADFQATAEDVYELRVKAIDLGLKASKATQDAAGWKQQLSVCRKEIDRLQRELSRCRSGS